MESHLSKTNQYIIRMTRFLIVGTNYSFNGIALLCLNAFHLYSAGACLLDDHQQGNFTKIHDILGLSMLILTRGSLIIRKDEVRSVLKNLEEPFEDYRGNPVKFKMVNDYAKEFNLHCTAMTIACFVGVSIFCTASFVYLSLATEVTIGECAHLLMGWTWVERYGSYKFHLSLNTFFMYIILLTLFQFNIILYCIVLNIKYKMRLLCVDLNEINSFLENSGLKESNDASKPDPRGRVEIRREIMSFAGKVGLSLFKNATLEETLRQRRIENDVKMFLMNVVEQHKKIIENVKVTDKAFRIKSLLYTQIGAVIIALGLRKLNANTDMNVELLSRGIEFFTVMGCAGIFNYFGQVIQNESESLRQALYNCDWTDKPHSLRRGLLIMQIMASKPLKLTIGGIYTLGTQSYGHMLQATYSYISLMQSLT